MYFGTALGATGLFVAAFRNSSLAYMNPLVFFIASMGLIIGTQFTNYHTQPALKHLLWLGFIGTTALGMVPLINMAGLPIIYDALFATGFSMAALGAVAYNAPSE